MCPYPCDILDNTNLIHTAISQPLVDTRTRGKDFRLGGPRDLGVPQFLEPFLERSFVRGFPQPNHASHCLADGSRCLVRESLGFGDAERCWAASQPRKRTGREIVLSVAFRGRSHKTLLPRPL